MADNPFDQFDPTPAAPSTTANPFDQFDVIAAKTKPIMAGDGQTITVTAKRNLNAGNDALGTDFQNYLAGIGKSLVDTGRGTAQTVAGTVAQAIEPTRRLYAGLGNNDAATLLGKPAAINEALKQEQSAVNERDAALMGTKAGLAGDITGQAALVLAPGAALKVARVGAVPGALESALLPETVRGAAIQGGVQGAVQPLTADESDQQRLNSAAVGGVAGAGGAVIPRVIGAVGRTGKALVAPFTEGGQNSIIADLAKRFGITSADVTPSAVPGVRPTLAEATGSPNAANFQRSLQNQPGAQDAFAEREAANNAKRFAYLQQAVGTPEGNVALANAREQVSSPLYDLARTIDRTQRRDASAVVASANAQAQRQAADQAATIRAQGALQPGSQAANEKAAQAVERSAPVYQLQAHPDITKLMNRPVFAQAVQVARSALQDAGRSDLAADPLQSLDGLQKVKWALDQGINQADGTPLKNADKATIASIKSQFMDATNQMSPAFKAANTMHAGMSKQLNANEVGQAILQRGTSAAEDVNGIPQVQRAKLAGAVRSADTIAQQVTGQKNATAASTLTPDQIGAFSSVLHDLARAQGPMTGSLPKGSPTVQNAISQNLLSSAGATPGLGLATNLPVLSRIASLADTVYKAVPKIQADLQAKAQEFALNPMGAQAQKIWEKLTPTERRTFEQLTTPYGAQTGQGVRTTAQQ